MWNLESESVGFGDPVNTKVLITGGAGFVGANLVKVLESDDGDAEVIVLDDLSTGFRENLAGTAATFVEGSILDSDLLVQAMDGCSAVIHLAARASVPRSIEDPSATHEVNATGTVQVLEACRTTGVSQVIVASSSSVYGRNEMMPKRENLPTRPMSPYAASKLASESYALAWGNSYDLPVLAFRFFNIYGPLQPPRHVYAAAVPAFTAAALQNRPVPIFGDGSQTRDFTYVDSVAEVIVKALREETSHPEPINLAFGTRISLLDLIARLESILDRPLAREFLPARVGDVPHSQADNSVLRSLFPDVKPTNLEDGLRSTVAWFKATRPWERPDLN